MTGDIDSVNHVGLAVRDLDAASALYEKMGFVLSPLSVHQGSSKPGAPVEPMATGNRCAVFGVNYIELLGIVNPGKMDWGWGRFVDRFEGAHIICYGCGDAAVVNERVAGNGIGTSGVIRLQRDIDVEAAGLRTARFDCVHFDGAATPEGLIQAAYHHNPEYVHQPRYQGHANGATDIAEVTLCMMDPEAAARRYEKLTGQTAKAEGDGWIIDLPRATRLRFLDPAAIGRAYPGTLTSPPPSIAAITFSVKDLEAASALLTEAGFPVQRSADKVYIPAERALGAIHAFVKA